LRNAVAHPEAVDNWLAILNWGGTILCAPKRGGSKHNLTSCIKKRISDFSQLDRGQPSASNRAKRKPGSADSVLAQAVSAKLEDGNLKAAIRLLVSDDVPAVPSMEGLAKLQQKHPPATFDASSLPAPTPNGNLSVAESDVQKALVSFPAGSSGVLMGFALSMPKTW
jgi:hypothetical protein